MLSMMNGDKKASGASRVLFRDGSRYWGRRRITSTQPHHLATLLSCASIRTLQLHPELSGELDAFAFSVSAVALKSPAETRAAM
jgi:hypothetical protein